MSQEQLAPEVVPAVAEAPVEVKEVNPLAEQFQRIAKQEKFVASERQKLEESRKALEAEKSLADNYKSLKGKNPFEILEHFGITYDQLVKADEERRSPTDPRIEAMKKRVDELESKVTTKDIELQKATEAKIAKAEMDLKVEIDTIIQSKEFDLIEKLDAKHAVREYMEEIYDSTGQIPSIEEACESVTNYLVTKFTSIKDSKWLKPRETSAEPVEPTITSKGEAISNKMTQSSSTTVKPITKEDRMRMAVQAMLSSG